MAIASRVPDFVAAHRRLAEPGWFVFGNRILMLDALTRACLQDGVEPETWTFADFMRRRGDVNRLTPLITLPLGPLRKLDTQSWESVRTCNLAVWRVGPRARERPGRAVRRLGAA